MTTRNTHNRQTFIPPVGFEPTISADERPKTYALDRADTGIVLLRVYIYVHARNLHLPPVPPVVHPTSNLSPQVWKIHWKFIAANYC
jgi:hypothetical protein